jgi:hypothetical protein
VGKQCEPGFDELPRPAEAVARLSIVRETVHSQFKGRSRNKRHVVAGGRLQRAGLLVEMTGLLSRTVAPICPKTDGSAVERGGLIHNGRKALHRSVDFAPSDGKPSAWEPVVPDGINHYDLP